MKKAKYLLPFNTLDDIQNAFDALIANREFTKRETQSLQKKFRKISTGLQTAIMSEELSQAKANAFLFISNEKLSDLSKKDLIMLCGLVHKYDLPESFLLQKISRDIEWT